MAGSGVVEEWEKELWGAPPAPRAEVMGVAGWARLPGETHDYRRWDGRTWTDDVADAGLASTDPFAGENPTAPPMVVHAAVPVDQVLRCRVAASGSGIFDLVVSSGLCTLTLNRWYRRGLPLPEQNPRGGWRKRWNQAYLATEHGIRRHRSWLPLLVGSRAWFIDRSTSQKATSWRLPFRREEEVWARLLVAGFVEVA